MISTDQNRSSNRLILFGVESIFAVEMIETAKRAGKSIAAAILAGEREWDLSGLEVSPSDRVDPGLSSLPFAVPWVTPGFRHLRVCAAREQGLREFATCWTRWRW
jgi:hypothetical protein